MQRLVLYSGCAAALALAAWLVVGTLEPGDVGDPSAQRLAGIPDTPPSPVAGSGAAVNVPPDPQRSRIASQTETAFAAGPQSPRGPLASRARDSQAARDANAAASADEDYAEDDPVLRALRDASPPDADANAASNPIRRAASEPARDAEDGSRTTPPDRAPVPAVGGIIALAPPIESAPTPTSAVPDVTETSQPPEVSVPQTPALPQQEIGSDSVADLPPVESFIDPTLPGPVQEVVRQDILTKQGKAKNLTGGR